jgi:hypothetical protein
LKNCLVEILAAILVGILLLVLVDRSVMAVCQTSDLEVDSWLEVDYLLGQDCCRHLLVYYYS